MVNYTEAATAELWGRILEKVRLVLKVFQLVRLSFQTSGDLSAKALKGMLKPLKDDF